MHRLLMPIANKFAPTLKRCFARAHEISIEESKETHHLQQVGMRVARLISPML